MSFNKIVIDRSIMFTHNDLYFSLKKKVYTGYQKKKKTKNWNWGWEKIKMEKQSKWKPAMYYSNICNNILQALLTESCIFDFELC